MKKGLAVVLVSGGMDSCVATAVADTEYDLALLHLSYGQRTEGRELRAFHEISDFYRAKLRLAVPMKHLSLIGGSSLTDFSIPVSKADLAMKVIPTSYVPFRNANMLSAAVSWAEVLEARALYIGAVKEDSSGYPDCREEFYEAFQRVVAMGTKPTTVIEVVTPVLHHRKADIVRRGIALGAPLHLTWSCYQREDVACGICDSCALRLRGFQEAGVDDPLPYAEKPSYVNV